MRRESAAPARVVSLAVAVLALAGCAAKTAAITYLDVQAAFDAALAVDQLDVAIARGATPIVELLAPPSPRAVRPGDGVDVYLDDTLAGAPLTVTVIALHGGGKIAAGSATATLVEKAGVRVTVPLAAFTQETPTSVTVTGAKDPLPQGRTVMLAVIATFNGGDTRDVTSEATFEVGDTNVATVSNGGVLHAVAPGMTAVRATLNGVTGTEPIAVTGPSLDSLSLTPMDAMASSFSSVTFMLTADYSNGSQPVTSGATWASSDTTVATVDPSGRATTLVAGTTTITATYDGLSAQATLTVK